MSGQLTFVGYGCMTHVISFPGPTLPGPEKNQEVEGNIAGALDFQNLIPNLALTLTKSNL